jgi:hypothetical protein
MLRQVKIQKQLQTTNQSDEFYDITSSNKNKDKVVLIDGKEAKGFIVGYQGNISVITAEENQINKVRVQSGVTAEIYMDPPLLWQQKTHLFKRLELLMVVLLIYIM